MGKILVVDDQLGVRRLLYEAFREERHTVELAAGGEEAIEILKSFNPDLIIMDMKMPGMNGIETLQSIRALNNKVCVIMMTAYGEAGNIEQARDLGVQYYLSKPFDLFDLRDRVNGILKEVS